MATIWAEKNAFNCQRAHYQHVNFQKKGSFNEIKQNCSSYVFFFIALINIFSKIGAMFFFISSSSLPFSRNWCEVVFFWSPSLFFSEIGPIVLLNVFFRPHIIRFWIFLALKQRKKHSGPACLHRKNTVLAVPD